MDELLILQETEFEILASVMGITKVYGLCPTMEHDEKLLMYTVHEMARKGIIQPDGNRFQIEEPYREIFNTIKNAKKILTLNGEDSELYDACFYPGERLISMEESRQDKNAVRIGLVDKDEFYDELVNRGYLPTAFWQGDIELVQMQEEEHQKVYANYQLLTSEQQDGFFKSYDLLVGFDCYRIVNHLNGMTQLQMYAPKVLFKQIFNDLYCIEEQNMEDGGENN